MIYMICSLSADDIHTLCDDMQPSADDIHASRDGIQPSADCIGDNVIKNIPEEHSPQGR